MAVLMILECYVIKMCLMIDVILLMRYSLVKIVKLSVQ